MVLNDHELFDYSGNDDDIALALLNIAIADEGSDPEQRLQAHRRPQHQHGQGHAGQTNNRQQEQQQHQQRGRSAHAMMQEQEHLLRQYEPEQAVAHITNSSVDSRRQWREEDASSETTTTTTTTTAPHAPTVTSTRGRRSARQPERRQRHRMGGGRPSAMPRLRPIRAVSPNPAYRGKPGRRRNQRDHNQRYLNALARRIAHHHSDSHAHRQQQQQQQQQRDVLGYGEDSDTEDGDPRFVRRMGPRPEHRPTAFQRLLASTQCMEEWQAFTSMSYASQRKLVSEGNKGGKRGNKGKGQSKALHPFHSRYSRISPHIRSALRDNRQPWAAVADLEATVLHALQSMAPALSLPTSVAADISLFPVQWQHTKRGKRAFVVTEVDAYMRLMLHGVCQYHGLDARTVEVEGARCVRVACHSSHTPAEPLAHVVDTAQRLGEAGSPSDDNASAAMQRGHHDGTAEKETEKAQLAQLGTDRESTAVDRGFDTYAMPLTHYLMHEFGGRHRGKPRRGRGSRRGPQPRTRRQPEPEHPVDLLVPLV